MDGVTVSVLGALAALVVAIVLILKKVQPTYAMLIGAVAGGLIGGAGLTGTVNYIISGTQGIVSAIIRIVTAGILAGALIESGAAERIAEAIMNKLGAKRCLIAITLATWVLTAVGVFGDVACITVAPIALQMAKRAGYHKMGVLMAQLGAVRAGNVMSPNPNDIAAAEGFGVPLTSIIAVGIIPAVVALIVTSLLAYHLRMRGTEIADSDVNTVDSKDLPPLWAALAGPFVTIAILVLRPIAGITIDPLIALPVGGIRVPCRSQGNAVRRGEPAERLRKSGHLVLDGQRVHQLLRRGGAAGRVHGDDGVQLVRGALVEPVGQLVQRGQARAVLHGKAVVLDQCAVPVDQTELEHLCVKLLLLRLRREGPGREHGQRHAQAEQHAEQSCFHRISSLSSAADVRSVLLFRRRTQTMVSAAPTAKAAMPMTAYRPAPRRSSTEPKPCAARARPGVCASLHSVPMPVSSSRLHTESAPFSRPSRRRRY